MPVIDAIGPSEKVLRVLSSHLPKGLPPIGQSATPTAPESPESIVLRTLLQHFAPTPDLAGKPFTPHGVADSVARLLG